MRTAIVAGAVTLSLVGLSIAADATASIRKPTDLPPQKLSTALQTVAEERDLQFIMRLDLVGSVDTQPVAGNFTVDEVLTRLLSGTQLAYRYLDDKTITIIPLEAATSAPNAREEGGTASAKEGKNHSSGAFRTARVAEGEASPAAVSGGGSTSPAEAGRPQLEEIVVTAQKREERLQDVPVPVSVLKAQALADNNQFRMQDYYATVPGLNFSMDSRGGPSVAIRGVTTGAYVTPTTAIAIDDVAFGSSNVISAFSPVPNVDPNEVSRIEVLRGPQGTLYGASSIGGLVKYVTIDPSTEALSGRVQLGTETIRNGDGAGYRASGSINVPLSDTFAIRANAFTHEDPGYIDNVQTGEEGVNKEKLSGGRLSALWRPSETFKLKLSALLQDGKIDGSSQINVLPGLGDLEQSYHRDVGGYERKIQAYSATATAKFGEAELTSITGYGHSDVTGSFDLSALLGFLGPIFGAGGEAWSEENITRKVSQEFRLAMPLGSRVDWLAGLFYTDEHTDADGGITFIEPTSLGTLQELSQTYEEYAAFTALTVRLTDRFDVQLGGRVSHNEQTYNIVTSGPLVPIFFGAPSPLIAPEAKSDDTSFTYLVTPRFRITPDVMVYARLASGYRPGGPNDAQNPKIQASFAPDETQNYELGAKADFFDRRLSLDGSLYYIQWRDIQLAQTDESTGIGFTGNGSRARSKGVELSAEIKPLPGMSISSWVVWNDAKLSEPLPPGFPGIAAVGVAGSRLPYSSRFSGSFSLDQDFALTARATGFVGGTLSYVGSRQGEFSAVPERQTYPSYAKTDLRAGVRVDEWTANLFVTNLTDRRALLDGGVGLAQPFAFHIIQPRTIGLNIARTF